MQNAKRKTQNDNSKLKVFKFLLLVSSLCFLVSVVARPVYAQVEIGEWFKLKGGEGIKALFPDFSSFGAFISSVLPNIYVIAGIILLFLLILGGFMYIVKAGQQDPEGVKKSKQAITAALLGFGLIFGSWWIIQIVEIVTGIDILK